MENQPVRTQVKNDLPNATAVLALGISSIILCWCQGIIGIILAIIALVLANRDTALYDANPEAYSENSYKNLRTGRTIALIGLILAAAFFFVIVISMFFLGLNFALFPWEMIEEYTY
jgi:hypothetical protein